MDNEDFQTQLLTGMHDLRKEVAEVDKAVAVTNANLEAQDTHLQGLHVTVSDIRDNGTQACKVNATEISGAKNRLDNLEEGRGAGNRRALAWGGGGLVGGGGLIAVFLKVLEIF